METALVAGILVIIGSGLGTYSILTIRSLPEFNTTLLASGLLLVASALILREGISLTPPALGITLSPEIMGGIASALLYKWLGSD